MAKVNEKAEKITKKELFIYLGKNTTTSEGIPLQKNFILEKGIVEKISDKEIKEKIISLSEYAKNKNKEVR